LDFSYSGCLNDHHIREFVKLIDEKISVSCQDSIGNRVAFIATSRASCNDVAYLGNGGSATSGYLSDLYVRNSIDPKDDSVDCDVAFPFRASSSYGSFNGSVASIDSCINTSDRLTNHQIVRSSEPSNESLSQRTISVSSSGGNIDYDRYD
jgi:hypothetical protein